VNRDESGCRTCLIDLSRIIVENNDKGLFFYKLYKSTFHKLVWWRIHRRLGGVRRQNDTWYRYWWEKCCTESYSLPATIASHLLYRLGYLSFLPWLGRECALRAISLCRRFLRRRWGKDGQHYLSASVKIECTTEVICKNGRPHQNCCQADVKYCKKLLTVRVLAFASATLN